MVLYSLNGMLSQKNLANYEREREGDRERLREREGGREREERIIPL